MKTLAGIADALDQVCLHEGMNILVFFGKYEFSGLNISQNAVQSVNDGFPVILRNNALLGQHRHMGNAALDILMIKLLIKRQ